MDQDRPPPRRASNRSCVAHRRADLPETGLRSSQRVLARTTDVSASSLPEATLPTMQASLQSTLHAPTIFESWLPMDSDIFRKGNCNASPTTHGHRTPNSIWKTNCCATPEISRTCETLSLRRGALGRPAEEARNKAGHRPCD